MIQEPNGWRSAAAASIRKTKHANVTTSDLVRWNLHGAGHRHAQPRPATAGDGASRWRSSSSSECRYEASDVTGRARPTARVGGAVSGRSAVADADGLDLSAGD